MFIIGKRFNLQLCEYINCVGGKTFKQTPLIDMTQWLTKQPLGEKFRIHPNSQQAYIIDLEGEI